jgi:transcriptional regulator of NAD metabolism
VKSKRIYQLIERSTQLEGRERREHLIKILQESAEPVSGTELSRILGVSRQVIVQDIALLRAQELNIFATTKGYLIYQLEKPYVRRIFPVKHSTDQIEDELCTIVDNGGKILDVQVKHEIYGEIGTELIIRNRQDVYDFVNKVKEQKIVPLKELTDGIHKHTIEADTEETLNRIGRALTEKGYLIE